MRFCKASAQFEGNFTYEVADDLTITITSFTSVSEQLKGPQPGLKTVIRGPIVMRGRITEDLSTIQVMQDEPFVETISTEDGTVLNQRICYRERTFTRLKRTQ